MYMKFPFILIIVLNLGAYSQTSITDIELSNQNIDENTLGIIGEFTSLPEDASAIYQYNLVTGDGDNNNSNFIISDNKLISTETFDFESNPNLSIRVKSTLLVESDFDYNLILKGIIDFTTPLGGVGGKAIHLYATNDIPDLSLYGIGVANNGGGTDGQEYTLPIISVNAGEHILLARYLYDMQQYIPNLSEYWDHTIDTNSSSLSHNGDDAIELFYQGNVIETFGEINADGTNQEWEYKDSWAYKDFTGIWTYGEVDCTDGSNTIFDSTCIYPFVNGDSGLTYTASNTEYYEKIFNISVNDGNELPIQDYITVNAVEQTPIVINLTASDPDGDQIVSYSVGTLPSHGFLSDPENNDILLNQGSLLVGNTITYTSTSDSAIQDYFSYNVSDGELSSLSPNIDFGNNIYHYAMEYDPQTNWISGLPGDNVSSIEELIPLEMTLSFEEDIEQYQQSIPNLPKWGANYMADNVNLFCYNPYPDEVNPSQNVIGRDTITDESTGWIPSTYYGEEDIIFYAYDLILDLTKSQKFSIKVYSEAPGINYPISFSIGAGAGYYNDSAELYKKTITTTLTNQWEEIIFDFSEGCDLYKTDFAGTEYAGTIEGGTLYESNVNLPEQYIYNSGSPSVWNSTQLYPGAHMRSIYIHFNNGNPTPDGQKYYLDDIKQVLTTIEEESPGIVDISIEPVEDPSSISLNTSSIEENTSGPVAEISILDPDEIFQDDGFELTNLYMELVQFNPSNFEVPETGIYILGLQENYGDGLNGGLVNVFIDGELAIENATIDEPEGWDETNCWPSCTIGSSAWYSFYAEAGQEVTFELIQEATWYDDAQLTISEALNSENISYELISGDGDMDNNKFEIIENLLLLNQQANFEETTELSIRIKSIDSFGVELESIFLFSILNVNDIYISSTTPISYCEGDGIISIDNVYETIGELSYSWSGPNGFTSLESSIENLLPGNYNLTLSDQYFEIEESFEIETEPTYNDLEICYITSDDTNYTNNRIYFSSNGSYNVAVFEVLRETDQLDEYESIGQVSLNESFFIDLNSNNQQQQYKYKVRTLDQCGDYSIPSSEHYNTLLQANLAAGGSVNLDWEPYFGVDYSTFYIYRSINQGAFELLNSLASNQFNYNDTDADVNVNDYSYYIGIIVDDCSDGNKSLTNTTTLKSNLLFIVDGALSDEEVDFYNQISLFPNPTDNIVYLKNSENITINKIEIYNNIGQLIETTKKDFISLNSYSSGLYFFKIFSSEGVLIKRIIKK